MTLIEKLESADGPNYALEQEIFRAVNPHATKYSIPPKYTASIDAALTLVPDSAFWSLVMDGDGNGFQACCQTDGPIEWYTAATPALALCIAALRAREQ